MKLDNKKVVVIGVGMVGMSYAYSLLNQNICDELVLIDVDKTRARGEAMDLSHGLPFSPSSMKIYSGDYDACGDANLVVICAGAPQLKGETRRDLLLKNYNILKEIVNNVMNSGFDGVFLVASNPVDIMTNLVYHFSNMPSCKVIGSGTSLDSARLRYLMSRYFDINPRNVHAYVIGEHGDSELVAWSNAYISVLPLDKIIESKQYIKKDLEQIAIDVRDSAYEIINAKKATYYGIGMVLSKITKAILFDEKSVYTVSAYLNGEYNQKNIYVGVPCVIDSNGIKQILEIKLNDDESEKFKTSCEILKQMKKEIGI